MMTLLGFDVGTTAIKMRVISQKRTRYSASRQLRTYQREDGASFQRSGEILAAIQSLVLEMPAEIKATVELISFSVAMHSLMPVTATGDHDEIFLWSDQQAAQTIQAFKQTSEAAAFYLRTGTPLHPMSPFAKLLYFKEQQRYNKQTRWWGLKELLMVYFTDQVAVDLSTASATGLLDRETLSWDEEILDFVGITKEQLAPIILPTDRLPLKGAAATLGFSPETMVAPGATDGCLAAYAGWQTTGSPNSLTIGTSAAVRVIGPRPVLHPEKMNFSYLLMPGLWVNGAPSNNGGIVLQWAATTLATDPTSFYQELPQAVKKSPIGANGIRFYPFLNGERAPYWTTEITGGFRGLTMQSQREDLLRSLLEGLLFNLRTLTETLQIKGLLTLNGGFFANETLIQMTADVLGLESAVSQENEPVFGLYYLLTAPQTTESTEVPLPVVKVDSSKYEAYTAVFTHYFEGVKES